MADATDAAAPEAAAPEKRFPKLLVIVLAAVIAALASGVAVYFAAASTGDEAAGAQEDERDPEEPKAPALYVAFDPPFVVNFEAKGAMRFLQISIEVMTRDQATADMLRLHDPMLRNDLLLLLGGQTYETISTREGKEQLRREALQAVAKVIGSEGGDAKSVEQLYFTSFVMQ